MPAPAMSSRHLYTEHRRGHIQPTPRLRTHRGGPLSRDHPQIPVSMPSLFRFDASAVVHTCSSSHRTPAPLTARRLSTAALTTPALDRRSLRWFGISAPTATPQDLPPSLAQHGSCRRSSTSSSLPFRTHVGAHNSAVVVDLPRCGAMLSPRVPSLVPIPGPRMARVTPGQRSRPNYGHPQAGPLPTRLSQHLELLIEDATLEAVRIQTPASTTSRRNSARVCPRPTEQPPTRHTSKATPRVSRATTASNHPSDTLRRTHQRIPKSGLTSHDRVLGTHRADVESSCPESRTDSWSPDGARNPWSAPTTELWAPTGSLRNHR